MWRAGAEVELILQVQRCRCSKGAIMEGGAEMQRWKKCWGAEFNRGGVTMQVQSAEEWAAGVKGAQVPARCSGASKV